MAISLPWPFGGSTVEDLGSSSDTDNLKRKSSMSALLRHYEAPGVPPPSARVDPSVNQQERQPVRLWDIWKYGAFAAAKATEVATEVVYHHVWGPRRKTWGIEMTLLTTIMRNAAQHSQLVDIATIRMLMSIGGMAPLPSDALITPVTFRVKRRSLRGILSEFDALETGTRELSGEWIVGKKLWKRLQSEWKSSNQVLNSLGTPKGDDPKAKQPKRKERVVLYLHGGAYYLFSAATHRLLTIPLSKYCDTRIFAVDYRLAPETRFPGPLHDAVSAYFRLVDDLHIPPENILVAGDSAGGGLTLALLMYLRDNDYPLPAAAMLFSPWVDLTMSCDSWDSNSAFDIVPKPVSGDHLDPVACYLGEHMEKYLTHPYASPLFGDLKGLPPLLITSGDAEVLRDEITLLAHKATLAGVEVRHELYEDAVHVFQAMPFLDAARKSFLSCRDFVRNVLPVYQVHSPQVLGGETEAEMEHEIVNEKSRMVSGDGLESESIESGMESESSQNDEDGSQGSKQEDPSWGQVDTPSPSSTPWPSPPVTDDEDEEETRRAPLPQLRRRPTSIRDGRKTPTKDRLQRIGSALSFLTDKAARPHSLTPSAHQTSQWTNDNEQHQRTMPHVPHPHLHVPALNMTSSTIRAPKPSIRRCNSSHPNISSLCKQWESSGPANQTMAYKRDESTSPRRSKSKSFSVFFDS
ncbi:hypothetical protein JAAARDRAFT_29104 [Jaapia argillacea MUCL 33604]|uniref:Alpha/beta hydrolase fold-3 domain-containing protein n=1 Tax=Jaapia argillacea MUCL 33604 TaxID=933084 RepID=A0A067Q815_9AGAM|nr:hypothetical protein JAAARDRAFT_29104 [Jaapia argillacea MUCL 33604]